MNICISVQGLITSGEQPLSNFPLWSPSHHSPAPSENYYHGWGPKNCQGAIIFSQGERAT